MVKEKILHLFMWDISVILKILKEIKDCGWTGILITPVQPSKEETNDIWYMRYQVTGLSIGNRYGTKEQLIELCRRAHEIGLDIYVDVVITHYGNKSKKEELIAHEKVDANLTSNPYFWREKRYIDYHDRYSMTHHCNGLAAVRVDNYQYQELVISFLNELIDCGIDGIRIDSAKMIALPEEDFGEPKNKFFERVLENLKKPIHIFGEVIFEKKELIDMYENYIDVLTEFNERHSYELNNEKTILFIESHDTFNDDHIGYTSKWETDTIVNNYRYLVKDFQKVLFYSRPFENEWQSDRMKEINWQYR